ncbi:MAG: hypothetical protein JKX71_06845 [Amylibacter sp.]|nr:hypothetical protein [Amylibacter sp.]
MTVSKYISHKRPALIMLSGSLFSILCLFIAPQPAQSGSKFMKTSPLVFHSHNSPIPPQWRSIVSYPGFVDRTPTPDNMMRVYSINDVPSKVSKALVVLGDKYGQLANPVNAIVKLRQGTIGQPLSEKFQDITEHMAKAGVTPAHFIAVSPGKITRPNVTYHYRSKQNTDAFFSTYQPVDVNFPLNGSLHCVYPVENNVFDYFQVNVGNVPFATLSSFMDDICKILTNQIK